MNGKRPGPAAVVTREVLLDAGAAQLTRMAARAPDLRDVLGLRLNDVLDEAGEMLRANGVPVNRRVAPSALYKYWAGGFDEFLRDLVVHLFPADGLPTVALPADGELDGAVRRHALADRAQSTDGGAPLYFGMFRGARDDAIASALRNVYTAYDDQVVPILRALLVHHGRRPRPELRDGDDGDDGVAAVATAMTALTEGLALRHQVDPDAVASNVLWVNGAVSLVMGLTEPVSDTGA